MGPRSKQKGAERKVIIARHRNNKTHKKYVNCINKKKKTGGIHAYVVTYQNGMGDGIGGSIVESLFAQTAKPANTHTGTQKTLLYLHKTTIQWDNTTNERARIQQRLASLAATKKGLNNRRSERIQVPTDFNLN